MNLNYTFLRLTDNQMTCLRWAELVVLFLGVPMVLAFALPADSMWTVLIGSAIVGFVLLQITDDFTWRELIKGKINWPYFIGLGAVTFAVALLVCWWLMPDRLLMIVKQFPWFLVPLALGYTFILVIPQEVIFRPLFFKRYAPLFKTPEQAMLANAVLFSFAHLVYMHVVVFAMTFIGSFIFARAYLKDGFVTAVAYHAIAGYMIFVSGLGWLFYTGGNIAN